MTTCHELESPNELGDAATTPRSLTQCESFHPGEFFSALLKQLYLGQPYVPRNIYVPVDFEDREELEDALSEQLAGEGGRADAGSHHGAAARRQARTYRSRRHQRQAIL